MLHLTKDAVQEVCRHSVHDRLFSRGRQKLVCLLVLSLGEGLICHRFRINPERLLCCAKRCDHRPWCSLAADTLQVPHCSWVNVPSLPWSRIGCLHLSYLTGESVGKRVVPLVGTPREIGEWEGERIICSHTVSLPEATKCSHPFARQHLFQTRVKFSLHALERPVGEPQLVWSLAPVASGPSCAIRGFMFFLRPRHGLLDS